MEQVNHEYQVTREIPQDNHQSIKKKGKTEDHTITNKHATARKISSQKEKRHTQVKPMPGLPEELREFQHLFKEREPEVMLPDHKPWDLEIKIKKGMKIKSQKMQ